MSGIARGLRFAFDGLRGVGAVLELERIAIDDSVVGEPERGRGGGDQKKFRERGPWEAKTGEVRAGRGGREEVDDQNNSRRGYRQEPSVIAREASRGQTQADTWSGLSHLRAADSLKYTTAQMKNARYSASPMAVVCM